MLLKWKRGRENQSKTTVLLHMKLGDLSQNLSTINLIEVSTFSKFLKYKLENTQNINTQLKHTGWDNFWSWFFVTCLKTYHTSLI